MIDEAYRDKGDIYFEYARAEMLDFVPEASESILEVGCGSAGFALLLKSRRPVHITGVEAFPAAASLARARVDRLIELPIENALPLLQGSKFDCIVVNDVLEHLVDPWAVLRQLGALLTPTGVVVASLPNVRYLPVFKDYVFRGEWRYQQDGVLDRTHLRFFTRSGMQELFATAGFRTDRMDGINQTPVSWKFDLLNWVCRGALGDTRFKQFACVARWNEQAS